MRTGQGQTARLAAMAGILAAATANLNHQPDANAPSLPIAGHSRSNWRHTARRTEVPNKTSRGKRILYHWEVSEWQ